MLGRLHIFILGLWLWVFAGVSVQAAVQVVIVSGERSEAYVAAADAVLAELMSVGVPKADVLDLLAAQTAEIFQSRPKVFVAIGAEAANVLAHMDQRAPVLNTLLPRASFERALKSSGRQASSQFSALLLDQPLGRKLSLIQLALPGKNRVAVLWSAESSSQAPALRAQAKARNLQLVEATLAPTDSVYDGLKLVLNESDVLLAIPDPKIYNSSGIQNLLLSSFRARVPLVGFAASYVRAGALVALYVTPGQLGKQAGALAARVLNGGALSNQPEYSQGFTVAVNEHVARSFGLRLDAQDLQSKLQRQEGAP